MNSTLSLSDTLEVLEMDRDHATGKAFNMMFMLWRYETTFVAYKRAIELAKELVTLCPQGIGTAHIVEVDAVPPSSETRAAFVEYLRLPGLRHYSVTHEGTGFKAAGVRAIVAAQQALARPRCEHAIFGDIPAAARWHEAQQRQINRNENASKIAECLNGLRAAHRKAFDA